MAIETIVEVVATPILPPGYAMVSGILKGPPIEAGYSGPVPPPQGNGLSKGMVPTPIAPSLPWQKTRVTTVRDTLSGHTTRTVEPYTQPADRSYSTTGEADAENARQNAAREEQAMVKAMNRGPMGGRATVSHSITGATGPGSGGKTASPLPVSGPVRINPRTQPPIEPASIDPSLVPGSPAWAAAMQVHLTGGDPGLGANVGIIEGATLTQAKDPATPKGWKGSPAAPAKSKA